MWGTNLQNLKIGKISLIKKEANEEAPKGYFQLTNQQWPQKNGCKNKQK